MSNTSLYTRIQAVGAAQWSVWTRDLRHVKAVIPRFWTKRQTWKDPRVKDVKPEDRIKWWNLVPGDQVRLLGDPEGTIREVHRINKLSNRVYLKPLDVAEDSDKGPLVMRSRQVHYSRCQLLVGHHQFPPEAGSSEPRNVPVFATRLSTSEPYWEPKAHRYFWQRFAVNTAPRLPGWTKDSNEKVLIPWPKEPKQRQPEATSYDTTLEAVTEITYKPPSLPLNMKQFIPSPPSEHEYIKSLSKRSAFDLAAPVEIYVSKELSNPHARAKKQARWQAFQLYKSSLLKQMIKDEFKDLKGRTRHEAKAEATWKWKNRLVQERKSEIKRRWKNRGQEAKLTGKIARKGKKEERIHKKLANLVLTDAPNQVVPKATSA